jgi:hypothetical protein
MYSLAPAWMAATAARASFDAAGDDRHVDVLGLEPHHQDRGCRAPTSTSSRSAPLAAAQHTHRLFGILGVGHRGAVVHRDLGRGVSWPFRVPTMRRRMIQSPVI